SRLFVRPGETIRTEAADQKFGVLVVPQKSSLGGNIPPVLIAWFGFVGVFHQRPASMSITSRFVPATPRPRSHCFFGRVIIQPLTLEFLRDFPFQVGDALELAFFFVDKEHLPLVVDSVRMFRPRPGPYTEEDFSREAEDRQTHQKREGEGN